MNLEIKKTKREIVLETRIKILEKQYKAALDLAVGLQTKLNAVK